MTTNNKQTAKSKEDISARFPKETKTKKKTSMGKQIQRREEECPLSFPSHNNTNPAKKGTTNHK
jgi:hypothetical protein